MGAKWWGRVKPRAARGRRSHVGGKDMRDERVEALLAAEGWGVLHTRDLPARPADRLALDDLPLAPAARRVLAAVPGGIYRHQHESLQAVLRGRDVCITTGTASGKTLVFQAAALDRLAREPAARVAVLYPLRALAQQQEERWRSATATASIPLSVARIDGSVPVRQRLSLLRQSRLVVFTPDVLHAWLLSNLGSPEIRAFVSHLRLIILDEAHSYSGVFGSNAAFLFRRLRHAVQALGADRRPQWFLASATMVDPASHAQRLCGAAPEVVGPDRDSSPHQEMRVMVLSPPEEKDFNTALGRVITTLAAARNARFIAFVDSRRQVEALAAIAARGESAGEDGEDDLHEGPPRVLPYRSGYEEDDRAQIQRWLQSGQLSGVVSTSALELGLDIGDLDLGIQVGVPRSVGTLRQRLGRVGRARPGTFLVILGDSPYDRVVRRNPALLFDRPLPGSTVYLENRRIQYIHAMCLSGIGGEADALGAGEGWTLPAEGGQNWPDGFVDLCTAERSGQVPQDLQALKADCGSDPWHAFPLRDAGTSFQIERRGADRQPLGSLSYAQLLREAYPGAVYYYMARPYRVTAVHMSDRRVVVTPERHYTTKPLFVPPMIYPNLAAGYLAGSAHGDLIAVEAEMQVTECVRGWQELRGRTHTLHEYPCSGWHRDALRRNFFTTGVCLLHPTMAAADAAVLGCACEAVYDAFVVEVPTESAEVAHGTGRVRGATPVPDGTRFLALYDSTYGSLRLTSRLLGPGVLQRCLSTAAALLREACRDATLLVATDGAEAETVYGYTVRQCQATAELLDLLADAAAMPGTPLAWVAAGGGSRDGAAAMDAGEQPLVILPGGVGLLLHGAEEEFMVADIFVHPRDGLMYRGRRVGEEQGLATTSFPVGKVRPLPGISQVGRYNFETGEISAEGPIA